MRNNKPKYIEGVGWRHETDTTRHHRESSWDYKGRAIYHITLATEGRYPIFGTLTGMNEKEAYISFTPLGAFVNRTFRGLPEFFAKKGIKIRILAVRIMPDHLHGVIHVLEPMPKSIGEIVRSFKSACTSWFKKEWFALAKMPEECINTENGSHEITNKNEKRINHGRAGYGSKQTGDDVLVQFCSIFAEKGSIWEYMPAGYHERILHCEGQLDHMIRYVKDNPRRLWLKRHHPDLFKIRNDREWIFTDEKGMVHTWHFRALGNIFLMEFPTKQHIQCSRSLSAEEVENYYNECHDQATQGVVSVTSAISEGEKSITRRLRGEGNPLIIIQKDGFPSVGSRMEKYFKPDGVYFDACAAGRLLLLEPYSEVLDDPLVAEAVYRKSPMATKASMRYRFLAMNKIGEMLTTGDFRLSILQSDKIVGR